MYSFIPFYRYETYLSLEYGIPQSALKENNEPIEIDGKGRQKFLFRDIQRDDYIYHMKETG